MLIKKTPNCGKNIVAVAAIENAAVECAEGNEYLSIEIFLTFRFFILRNGRGLLTHSLISHTSTVLIIKLRINLLLNR
jgi:hypothetical protein